MPRRGVGGEIRVADHDDARFGLRRVGVARLGRRRRAAAGGRHRRGERDRALLVALALVERHLAASSAVALMSVSAQLRGLVSTNACAVWPLTPPVTGVTDRASGNAVMQLEPLGDRRATDSWRATGTDASVPISRPMPLTSTTMLLPTSMPQSCASAIRLVSGGLSALSGGSISRSSLPGLVEVLLQRVDLRREEVGLRPRDDHHRRIVGHRARLGEHQLVDGVVLAAERCRRWRCSRRARRRSCPSRRGPG